MLESIQNYILHTICQKVSPIIFNALNARKYLSLYPIHYMLESIYYYFLYNICQNVFTMIFYTLYSKKYFFDVLYTICSIHYILENIDNHILYIICQKVFTIIFILYANKHLLSYSMDSMLEIIYKLSVSIYIKLKVCVCVCVCVCDPLEKLIRGTIGRATRGPILGP